MATHASTTRMLEDLSKFALEHPGAEITSVDDDAHSLIRFLVTCSKVQGYLWNGVPWEFSIKLQDLRRTPPPDDNQLRELIVTRIGRAQIAAMLQVPVPFDLEAHMRRPTAWARLLEDDE